ncbi:hypothetical protein M0802_001574 [Mischocyttarus mexicanus]|nr:hypothetical protein M0802_001574 [Mischocyttarus mexicanus]
MIGLTSRHVHQGCVRNASMFVIRKWESNTKIRFEYKLRKVTQPLPTTPTPPLRGRETYVKEIGNGGGIRMVEEDGESERNSGFTSWLVATTAAAAAAAAGGAASTTAATTTGWRGIREREMR